MKKTIFILAAVLNGAATLFIHHSEGKVGRGLYAQSIAAGYYHSLALCSNGTVRSWGDNGWGQLGNGTNISNSNVPVQVSSLTGIVKIAAGGGHSLALKNDGTVWTWGRNDLGQLGIGSSNNDFNVPMKINSFTGVSAIAAGGFHSLALKNDGTVWAWGSNSLGQLGNGNYTNSNVPVQVSNIGGVIAIAGGDAHSLALKNDGSVWSWGDNLGGQLGNGTSILKSNVPVQVSSLTGVIAIAAGAYHSLALKNDGTVWAWGDNGFGQLGNGTNIVKSNVPVQVSSLTGVIAIAAGAYHSLALKNDGTVWAWGYNNYGQLGNGSNIFYSNVPVQVSSLTGVIAVAAMGSSHSLALKNDGTVWAWGANGSGQLGIGNYY
jgi:alpha-tubulin suppressor-like RCC1 family protein